MSQAALRGAYDSSLVSLQIYEMGDTEGEERGNMPYETKKCISSKALHISVHTTGV